MLQHRIQLIMFILFRLGKQINTPLYTFSKTRLGQGSLKPPIPPFKQPKPPPTIINSKKLDPAIKQDLTKKKDQIQSQMAGSIAIKQEQKIQMRHKIPVITVMGHVDHGKTTLIDYLRKSNIAEKEDGGITQRIGAFRVQFSGKHATFIDTPGHEAFINMRKRGATMTDVVILVVSAIEGVKKQTLQVIELIKKMELKVIVAINKIDLPQANPEQIESQLQKAGLHIEQNGGNIPVVHISAKTGLNIDLLCDLILEDTKDKKSIFSGMAEASVLQAFQNKQGLNCMTIIMQKGVLKTNSIIILGKQCFKIKTIKDDNGNTLNKVTPGQAALILGIPFIPAPGEHVIEVESEKKGVFIIEQKRKESYESQRSKQDSHMKATKIKFQRSRGGRRQKRAFCRGVREVWMNKFQDKQDKILTIIEELQAKEQTPQIIELLEKQKQQLEQHKQYVFEYLKNTGQSGSNLNFIIKFGDRGMEETIMLQMQKLKPNIQQQTKVKLNLIKSDVGDVTISDIQQARNCSAKIFTFGSGVSQEALSIINGSEQMPHTHKLIHNLLKDLKAESFAKKLKSIKGKQRGRAEIASIYELKIKKKVSKVPGFIMTQGKINKNLKFYIFRNKIPITQALSITFLKSFKKQMVELKKGQEGTLCFAEQVSVDLEKGDQIVAFEE